MACLEVSGAVRLIYRSLGVKGLTELPGYKPCIVCVYGSPHGQFDKFLNKLVS